MQRSKVLMAGVAVAVLGVTGAAVAGAANPSKDRTQDVRRALDGGRARNVIMLIGDGMGDSEITIARKARVYGSTDLDGSQPDAWRYLVEVQDAGKPADVTGYR